MSGAAGIRVDTSLAGDGLETFRADDLAAACTVGERRIWFSERAQEIQSLNPTAAFIWDALSGGASPQSVVRDLSDAGLPTAQAEVFVSQSLGRWLEAGELRPLSIGDRPDAGAPKRRYAILDLRAELTIEGDLDLAAFDAVFGHLQSDVPAPDARLRVVERGGRVYGLVGGRGFGSASAKDAVPLVKAMLTESLLASFAQGFAVHTACLVRNGGAWLLLGAPGAGKSTLAAALAHAGFGYAADDVTAVRPDATVAGAPFALALKSGAWPLCTPFIPDLESLPTHVRSDRQEVRYARPLLVVTDPVPVRGIVVLNRSGDAASELTPLDPAEALTALLATAYSPAARLGVGGFRAAASLVSRARTTTLTYERLDEAVALLAAEAARE